ncbi:MAG: hypothetical protein IJ005_00265 [Bacteroidales bacterium]|nr:hypothetical protein [Bacteroidales bacterium]
MKKIIYPFLLIASVALGTVSCKTESRDGLDRPVLMLRLRPTNTESDKAWDDTYRIIKENPGCCDQVWFSTGMGYLPSEWHADKVSRISKAMGQLRSIGVSSALQFQMTIGHGDKFGVGKEDLFTEKTWTGWTGSTGVEAEFCSCPRHPDFLSHIRMVAGIYAALKPSYVWVDDDLRYDNHKPATLDSHIGCWCDGCIAEFNTWTGGSWTRITLSGALKEDASLNEAWHSFCEESLCNIAAVISEEIHRISPSTKMAFQAKKEDFVVPHVSKILSVMHETTGLSVGYRPGTGARFDIESPSGQIVKSMQSARFISLMENPSYVDLWCPEIETWPRVYGSRTAQGVLIEGFTALAYGLNSVSMFIMAADMEEPDLYSRSLLYPISKGYDVLKGYAGLNEGTFVVGYQNEGDCEELYEFARTGVPVQPGEGRSLGCLSYEFMKTVDVPKQLSEDIQLLRDTLCISSPAACCSPFVGLLIPRVDADGILKTVGVVNTRIDVQEQVKIRLSSLPEVCRTVYWHELKEKPVRLRLEHDGGQTYAVIPSIAAWNAGYLSFE